MKQEIKARLELSQGATAKAAANDGAHQKPPVSKNVDFKLILKSVALTLAPMAVDAYQGYTWDKTVHPQKTMKLELQDLEMNFEGWDNKSNILEGSLQNIKIEHHEDEQRMSVQKFSFLAVETHSCSMRNVLMLAEQLERAFCKADVNSDGTLSITETRVLLNESFGMRIDDSQLEKLNQKLDSDKDGSISLEEFVQLSALLCSKTSEVNFRVPVPSSIPNDDKSCLSCVIKNVQDDKGFNCKSSSVKLLRFEIGVAMFPLRNLFDWLNLLKSSDESAATPSALTRDVTVKDEAFEDMATDLERKPTVGIPALRASFESKAKDIFVPPKCSSTWSVEIQEMDLCLHDLLAGNAALFLKAGPLLLGMSYLMPIDAIQPFHKKVKLDLKSLRVQYAHSKLDLDCELEDVVAKTSLILNKSETMPQNLKGSKIVETLAVSETCLQLSLAHVLFLKSVQRIFEGVQQGSDVRIEELPCASYEPQRALPKGLSRRKSPISTSTVVEDVKHLRNIDTLTRIFTCPKLTLAVIDDLPEIEEGDATNVEKTKLFELRVHDAQLSETVEFKNDVAVVKADVSIKLVVQATHAPECDETLLEPWQCGVEIRTCISREHQSIKVLGKLLDVTITPDHIERPRLTMNKFDQHLKRQDRVFKVQLKHQIEAGFKQINNVAVNHKLASLLSDLNPGDKRKIRNRTDMAILCRVYHTDRCDTIKDNPVIQIVLRPGASISLPKSILKEGVLVFQPSKPVDVSEDQKTGQKMMQWAIGTWSNPQDLSLAKAATYTGKSSNMHEMYFVCDLTLVLQLNLSEKRLNPIVTEKGPSHAFKSHLEKALDSSLDHLKHVNVRSMQPKDNGLRLEIDMALISSTQMAGFLFDFAAQLTQNDLSQYLLAHRVIESAEELVVVSEAILERHVDCSSPLLPKTWLTVASTSRHVDITAPWKLQNSMPKTVTFHIYDDNDSEKLPFATVALEAGQELLQYSPLTVNGGISIEMEFDGYISARHKLARLRTKSKLDLLHARSHSLTCHVHTTCHVNSQFVVTTYMSMVIINRTGLDLSFGCCRPKPTRAGEDPELEIVASTKPSEKQVSAASKRMSKVGNEWIIAIPKDAGASLSWNTRTPDITLLHLPPGGWSPCVNMAGSVDWQPLKSLHEAVSPNTNMQQNPIFSMNIMGPPPFVGGPDNSTFTFNLGVAIKEGLAPFHLTTYVTITPKYTVVNCTNMPMHICQDLDSAQPVLAEIGALACMSTLGIFREFEPSPSLEMQRQSYNFALATSFSGGLGAGFGGKKEKDQKITKIRIRLMGADGISPITRLSQPFTIDDTKSVPLRLLYASSDTTEAVIKSIQVFLISMSEIIFFGSRRELDTGGLCLL